MVKFLIEKPIAVIMTALGILILGLYTAGFIPISLMPDIDIPEITVQVQADNLSARQMEDVVVKRLRSSLQQVSHLKDISSEARNEFGIIKLNFSYGTNVDYAFIEVNEKIDRTISSLPKSVKRPKVIKASATDIPVFYLSMSLANKTSKTLSEETSITQDFVDFNKFSNQVILKRIEQIEEVAMVDVSGILSSEIVIVPDKEKLNSLGISLNDLESIVKKNDIEIGNLLIKDNQYQYDIRLGNSLKTIADLANIYIKKDKRVYQLKDLATVKEQPRSRTGLVLSDTNEAVTMAVIKQSDAKMSDLKASLQRLMNQFKKDYPHINFTITRDQTKLLDYAINNLFQSLLWGILLAFGIMFLFLKNIKSPLLIGITIPTSIIICLLFFYFFSISINIISLSGLVLGIGLMIDNSIIVIDNITQYRERGFSITKACIQGVNEVIKPLLSSALTTCAVFLPLVFLSGISGALFYDQAMAIAIGLFVSLFVSITLLPILYRLFHLKNKKEGFITRFLTKANRLDYAKVYERGFKAVMRYQKFSWIFFVLLLLLSIGLYTTVPKTQMPTFTTTETIFKIDWNEPINVEENKKRILRLVKPIQDQLVNHTALVGVQQFLLRRDGEEKTDEATIYLQTNSEEALKEIQNTLQTDLQKSYNKARFNFEEVNNIFSLLFSNKEANLVAKLKNNQNLGTAENEILEKTWYAINNSLTDFDVLPISWQNQIVLNADAEKLITYNVNANSLFSTLRSAFNKREILSISDNQNFVPVILGGKTKTINDILATTKVQSNDSTFFDIKNFIKTTNTKDLKTIYGGKDATYYPINLGVADKEVNATIATINNVVSKGNWYEVSFTGKFFSNKELISELRIVLLISLVLLYFILAAQFESFLLPLIILLEVPIDLAGAFLFLKIFGMSINLMSMIGIVVMSGIIINDSILKIDTIIQLQRQGYSLLKALLVAGQRRLKPILMTSLTTILALIPLLFSNGLGAELQAPLAVALIGGMFLGTIVSLYFIPLCYYYFSKNKIYAK
jgi:multidrug efflux pump subunit AcrB